MNKILVSYDLRAPGRDYSKLHGYLQSFAYWAKPLESVYLLKTSMNVAQVRDALMKLVDSTDRVLALEAGPAWAAFNLGDKVTDWMKANI